MNRFARAPSPSTQQQPSSSFRSSSSAPRAHCSHRRYLTDSTRSFFPAAHARRFYYLAFFVFWSALLAVPISGNLGEAWLFVEATTAASAMLVAYSGGRHALEAGWKYLVLTTAGLTVALTGIVIVYVAAPAAHHNLQGSTGPRWARRATRSRTGRRSPPSC